MDKKNIADLYPLSPMQQGMLFHSRYAPDSGVYVEQMSFLLEGDLDTEAFAQAWQRVMTRHAVLRTCFLGEALKEPVQVVARQARLPLAQIDWRKLEEPAQAEQLRRYMQAEVQRGFDLAQAPLFRLALIQLAEQHYQLVWTFHHILLDGWSVPILLQELFAIYQGLQRHVEIELPRPKPYRDYIAWLKKQDLAQAEPFWRDKLNGITAPTPLPYDRSGTQEPGISAQVDAPLSVAATERLQELAPRHQLTMNTLVQAAWALALSRYSNETDVVFGVTVSGRPPDLPGSEAMVGLFINTLPARMHIDDEQTLLRWLQDLQAQQVELRRFEYSPLVEIQGWSEVPRSSPMFHSILVFENYPLQAAAQQMGGALRLQETASFERTNYPITLVAGLAETLHLRIVYDDALFEESTIRRMLGHLHVQLETMTDHLEQPLRALPLLTAAERKTLLEEWNGTAVEFPSERCAHELFEMQVDQTPHALALVFEEQQLSYEQLDRRANQIAHRLQQLGVGPEKLVAIALERSPEMIISLLAVLKAGGAYVPIDPAYPPQRLSYMLADSQAMLLISQSDLAAKLELPEELPLLALDREGTAIAEMPASPPSLTARAENLAYVIYTSGSTGRPKGTMLRHRGLCNLATACGKDFALGPGSRFLQFFTFSFDGSVLEIFGALLSGAALVMAPRPTLLPGRELVRLLRDLRVSHLIMPPSALAAIPEDGLPDLAVVISGGESCTREIVARWGRGRRFFNAYGPTEITVACTWHEVRGNAKETTNVPIGRPIANTKLYVVDRLLRPVPIGVPGELLIGGAGVARGYLNRAALTAEKFVPDPFSDDPDSRLYRSGDLVRYRPDGNIEFLGRIDHQVKVRGFRIELEEIQVSLNELDGVADAVVVTHEDKQGDAKLVAYLVPELSAGEDEQRVRQQLARRLPDYMIPSLFVWLDALPLKLNGKVDRQALPQPEQRRAEAHDHVPPRDVIEERLAKIWADVLGGQYFGVLEDFFSLGGHSLLAVRVIAQIEKQFGQTISLTDFYSRPTISNLAAVLNKGRDIIPGSRLVPLQTEGAGRPLFFIHPSGGSVHWYVALAEHLGKQRPFYGIQARGLKGRSRIATTIEEMAFEYVAALRTVQPAGPYLLGSWSFGVIVVYEMAQQLRAAGEQVALLAMLDQGPYMPTAEPEDEAEYLVQLFQRHLDLDVNFLRTLPEEEQVGHVYVTAKEANWLLPDVTFLQFRHFVRLMRTQSNAWRHYQPVPYRGHITLFRAEEQDSKLATRHLGWQDLALEGVTVVDVPGDHLTMLQEPLVATLARQLKPFLREQQRLEVQELG